MKLLPLILICCLTTGCLLQNKLAPIDVAWYEQENAKYHTVQLGDTLHALAFRYAIDYRALISANHITPPYHLYQGQRLVVQGGQVSIIKKPSSSSKKPKFVWPAIGKLQNKFARGNKLLHKGISIFGNLGQNIYAAAAGKVVYASDKIKGYGKLVIIKHNDNYVSAYAFNQRLLVKENEHVSQGQPIATMGLSSERQSKVHFEIRYRGKSVNPLKYLTKKR